MRVDGQCECGLESDEDRCGGEEKERKTEVRMDGRAGLSPSDARGTAQRGPLENSAEKRAPHPSQQCSII